jgi:hypothetical protein
MQGAPYGYNQDGGQLIPKSEDMVESDDDMDDDDDMEDGEDCLMDE